MTNQRFETSEPYEHEGYSPGHPWYYFLGGRPKRPKEILEATRLSEYQGYAREDIKAADALPEPKRSEKLRSLRAKFEGDLRRDISRYRECIRELRQTECDQPKQGQAVSCGEIHTALSLKHNHMVNNFGHLIYLDDLLSKQLDLFEL